MRNVKMFALAALVAALVLAGCGGNQTLATQPPAATTAAGATQPAGGGQAGVTPAAPTAAAAQATAGTDEEDLSLGSVTEGLGQLASYRSRYTIRFKGTDAQGQAIDNTWELAEDFTRDPAAQRISSSVSKSTAGAATENNKWESIRIGQITYIVSTEADGTTTCISVSSSDTTPPQQALSPDMWGGVSDAKYVNTETVNGIRAKHYAWKEGALAGMGLLSGKGETWVAVDGGYVVKQVIEGTGKGIFMAEENQEGTTTIEYNITEANGSVQIAAPANCETASTDIPILPDALDKTTFGDMVSYRSPTAFADAVSFYKTEMPAKGWQASGEATEMEGFAQLTFTKDNRTATVMLSQDASSNETSVIVQVSKE